MQKLLGWIRANLVDWFKEHTKPFWKGFFGGFGICSPLLFAAPPFLSPLVWSFLVKLAMAGMCAFVAGLGTSLATDFYKTISKRVKKLRDAKRKRQIEKWKKSERA